MGLLVPAPARLQVATVPEYDRSLLAQLIAARFPHLWLSRTIVGSDRMMDAVVLVVIADSAGQLDWLAQGTLRLGADVDYLPIRSINPSGAGEARDVATAALTRLPPHADAMAAAAESVLVGPDVGLRRLVAEGQYLRRTALTRDRELAATYAERRFLDPGLVHARAVDSERYRELRDEFWLLNGGQPHVWPF